MTDILEESQPPITPATEEEPVEQQEVPAETETVSMEPESTTEQPAAAPIKPRRKLNVPVILAIVVLALALIAGGGFLGLRWYESSRLEQARAALAAGQWEAAEATCEQVLQFQSTGLLADPLSLIEARGEARFHQDKFDPALADLALVQQAQPDNAQIYLYQAEIYFAQGKLNEAMAAAAQAQKRDDKLAFPYALQAYDAYRNNQFAPALEKAEAAIERDTTEQHPAGIELAYLVRGSINAWQHDPDAALADLDKALELAPNQPQAIGVRAYVYYLKYEYEKVKNEAAALQTSAPNTADALWAQALMELDQYEFVKANQLLTQAIEKDSSRPEFYIYRSFTYILADDDKKIQADLEKALELNPDFAQAVSGKAGWLFIHYEDVDIAAEAQRVLELSPNSHLGHSMLVSKYLREHAWDKALAEAELVIASKSHPTLGYTTRGEVYLAQNEMEKALADFQKAAELDPRNAEAYYGISTVHLSNKAYDKAHEALDKALALDPDSGSLHILRAFIFKSEKKDDKASKEIEEAFKTDPNCQKALYGRALFTMSDKNPMKAMSDVNKLAEYLPKDPNVMVLRARVYLANNDVDLALEELNKAYKIDKNLSDLYTVRAQAYMMKGEPSKAVEHGKKGLTLAPWDTTLQAIVGEAYYQDGDHAKAIEMLTQAIEGDPELTHSYFTLSMAQWDQGDVESALKSLETMMKHKGDLELEQIDIAEKSINFLSSVPQAVDGKRTQVDEKKGFSITYPVNWVPRPPEGNNVVYTLVKKEFPVSNIKVIAGDFGQQVPPGYSSAVIFSDVMKQTLTSLDSGYTFVSRNSFEANGTTGCVDTYEHTITDEKGTNYPFKTSTYIFVSSRYFVVVQYESLLPLYDDSLAEAEEIIKTFTFTKP